MNAVLAILAGNLLIGMHGQRPLLWLAERRADPGVLLTGWILSSIGLVGSMIAGVSLLALPGDEHPASGVFRLAGGCWGAVSSGSLPGWRELLAGLSVTGMVGILCRLGWAVKRHRRRQRQNRPHLAQLRLLAAGVATGYPLWVRDDRPMALSIGGRPGVIVMTDTLREHLSPAALAATLEHERAHLRGRHHVLVTIVEVLASAFPACPLLHQAPTAARELIELAADAQAARRCGPAAVQEALCRLTGHPVPAIGLAMTGQFTETRLRRLNSASARGSRFLRLAGRAGLTVSALILPTATAWLATNILGCVVT